MRKLLVAAGVAIGLVGVFSGSAFAANDSSVWVSCQHGLSIEMSGWPKAYTVTITDNGAPFTEASNRGAATFSHTESDNTTFAIVDQTIPHTFVIDVTTSEAGKSSTDTIDMPACGAGWPGYAFTTKEP